MIRMFRKLLVWLIQWATAADQVATPLAASTEQPTAPPAPADTGLHFGPPAERNIFRYWDGTKERAADPMVLWEKVITFPGDLKTILGSADRGELDGIREASELICMVLDVHEFEPTTETGLTREELNQLMVRFMHYINDLKKKLAHLPMPSRPLDSTSSQAVPVESTTPPESDCCSMENASNVAEPITS